ncbi:MAG: hypothetical protein E7399_01575 [Ruminococcaceae bacterium]|nr:hypothetical protein [Oscillospiraceae bacterium]
MKNIVMIGSTHFDPVWTWTWEEGMASIHSTFRSALDRMKEDEEFIYSFSTPPVFEWIREIDPAMFEEIKERVKEGRWELCEGWWVQPDCFTGCGESYVRQSLYGQLYLKEQFGRYSRSVFNVDSFGHNSQIPQILKKSHMDYYCMCRPEQWFFELDSPYFWWEGKDGSRVQTFRIGQYSEIYNKDMRTNVALAESNMKDAPCDEMMVYGITNHGGAPTKKAISDIHELNGEKEYSLPFSTVAGYFEMQEEPSHTVSTEMITKNFGPYVNLSGIKQKNRTAEYAVLNAEKTALLAETLLNIPYKKEVFASCWKDILFNHFHDILGGASTKEVYVDANNQLGRVIFTANERMHLNLQAITKKINTPGKNPENPWNVVVWNLEETPYHGYLEAEMQWLHEFPAYSEGIVLEDEDGTRYPCQIILETSVIPGFRSRVLFKAEIPSVGYKLFKVIQTGEQQKKRQFTTQIETEEFSVQIDETTGFISSIYSKKLNKTFADLLVPKCFEDEADNEGFSATTYGKELEGFTLLELQTLESGPARWVLKADFGFRTSLVSMYYTFYRDIDYFDVAYRANWNEKHTVVKLMAKTGYDSCLVASPYASEIRGDTDSDAPMGEWIRMYDQSGEVAILSGGVFAYTKEKDLLGLSLLRSCIYADMRLDSELKDEDYPYTDFGISEGKLRIVIHEGKENRGISALAKQFNNPPIVLCEANHEGMYPAEQSFVSLEGTGVVLGAMKKQELGEDTVIRLAEVEGNEGQVILRYFGKKYAVSMNPYEIKTLKIDGEYLKEVYITEDEIN